MPLRFRSPVIILTPNGCVKAASRPISKAVRSTRHQLTKLSQMAAKRRTVYCRGTPERSPLGEIGEVARVRKPRIGITPTPSVDELPHGTFQRYTINAAYANAVVAGGGIPLVLPLQTTDPADLLDSLDGLLLSGGGDIDPRRFGADPLHPATYGISAERDQFELDLLRLALDRDTPVLCICRGIQVLNVALGGTLIQDVPTQHPAASPVQHRQQVDGIPANHPGHTVMLAEQSLLHELVGQTTLPVNSFHHQAIDRLAAGLEAIAHAPDGTIEAVVMPDRRFVLGVQWHPELMVPDHRPQMLLFRALVDEARMYREQSAPLSVA